MLKDTGKDDNKYTLANAYDAANSTTYRLFFLRDVFEALGNPNINGIELTTQSVCGLAEIIDDVLGKAMDTVEIIDNIHLRQRLHA